MIDDEVLLFRVFLVVKLLGDVEEQTQQGEADGGLGCGVVLRLLRKQLIKKCKKF